MQIQYVDRHVNASRAIASRDFKSAQEMDDDAFYGLTLFKPSVSSNGSVYLHTLTVIVVVASLSVVTLSVFVSVVVVVVVYASPSTCRLIAFFMLILDKF